MQGIYREITKPDHTIKVLKRDAESIAYEDGGRIICTKRIRSFDLKYQKDTTATVADFLSDFKPALVK
jgi:hypothetical protein